jgi:hypothetical protein
MIGKIVGAVVGKRIAERHGDGLKGAVLGAAAPAIAKRLFGPLGLVIAGGYVAKKIYDSRRDRRAEV